MSGISPEGSPTSGSDPDSEIISAITAEEASPEIDATAVAVPADLKQRLGNLLSKKVCENPSGLLGTDDDRGLYRPSGRHIHL